MNNKKYFMINDEKKFIDSTRVLVFNLIDKEGESQNIEEISMDISELNEEDAQELNTNLSYRESKTILQQYARWNKSKTKFKITEENFVKFIDDLNARIFSNIISDLASKGLLESAYDAELDDFIFWPKE